MIQTVKMNLDDGEHLALVAKALSSEVRIEMLKHLRQQDYNVNELAEALSIPASSLAAHVKVLEEAEIIKTALVPGVRGSMKVCSISLDHLYVELRTEHNPKKDIEILKMPVGSYTDYSVAGTCGLCGAKGPIGVEDAPRSFYDPERFEAQILWFQSGYVEYRFPNQSLLKRSFCLWNFPVKYVRKTTNIIWIGRRISHSGLTEEKRAHFAVQVISEDEEESLIRNGGRIRILSTGC